MILVQLNLTGSVHHAHSACPILCGQLEARQAWGDDVYVPPYVLFSDNTELTRGGTNLHPMYLWLASMPLSFLRLKRCYRHVALFPIMDAEALSADGKSVRLRPLGSPTSMLHIVMQKDLFTLQLPMHVCQSA